MRLATNRMLMRPPAAIVGLAAGSYNLAPSSNSGFADSNVFAGGSTLANAYGAARAGGTFGDAVASVSAFTTTGTSVVGQSARTNVADGGFDADVWETFLEFDTTLQAGRSISAATLSVFVLGDNSTTNFLIATSPLDYGASISTADFVPGASLSSTPVASRNTSATGANTLFALTGDFSGSINTSGPTRLIVYSSRSFQNFAPGDGVAENVTITISSCRLNLTVA